MAKVINMPRLSDTMEEGTLVKWLKKEGDTVKEGDILAEIETDKATMEFEAFDNGVLLHTAIAEGEVAPVDGMLAIIGKKGEDISNLINNSNTPIQEKSIQKEDITPKEEKLPQEETHKTTSEETKGRIFASPLARKMAEEKEINISKVKGTGDNGRVIKIDILNYKPYTLGVKTTDITSPSLQTKEVPNSQMRKIIAKKLSESKFTAPHYYLTLEVDMDNAIEFRMQLKENEIKVSFNDIVLKASAMALKENLQINTSWDDTNTRIHEFINIGVAIAVPDGLVVPVINNTDLLSLTQIGTVVRDFAIKAKDKKLTPEEMSGSTFTVSNLGMFGIEEFTSIINQPNSAILSVGSIVQKPIVKNDNIVIGNTMKVTLACDHRTIDGATGAQFLQSLKKYIETPVLMLV